MYRGHKRVFQRFFLCAGLLGCSPIGPEAPPSGPGSSLEGQIAFLGGGSGRVLEILAGQANGSGVTRIVGGLPDFVDYAWSPDATAIVYATNFGGTSRFDLFSVRIGSEPSSLGVEGRMPSWSPDGSKIAFVGEDEAGRFDIYTMSPDGSDVRALTRTTVNEVAPAWSPDGTRLAYEVNYQGTAIHVINADGSGAQRVVHSVDSAIGAPAWSPDGSQIAFNSTMHRGDALDPLGQYEIYVMKADGSDVRRLTFLSHQLRALRFPTWSPDGHSIAFESQVENQLGFIFRVFVVGADGSDPKEIDFGRGARSPKWAPR